MTKINSLDDIVKNGLCIGCGICKSIAGNSLTMEMSDKGNLEPKELTPITNETLEEIKKVCPGVIAEGPEDHKENEGANKDLVWGNYFDLYYSWSTDPKIRFQSSTGGLLNGLSLYLLEQNKIDFIMHTAGDKDNPMRNIVKYSYNKEDLINCESRSRYGPSSPLSEFHKALDKKQTFAFVGKPCDAGAIRLLAKSDERVDQYCKYIFTLVCGGFQELTKSQEFIDSFDVKEQELEEFRYRGFGNPGRMYIKTKDQREFDKDYNSFWGDESNWKVPFRCKICPDAIGESSDIAALDTWRGGSPKGEDEGFNAAVMRTKKGIKVFNEAVESGYLVKGDKITIEDIKDFQPHQTSKKQAVYARHLGMKNNNIPTIMTKNLRIEELYNLNDDEFNKQQEQGVTKKGREIMKITKISIWHINLKSHETYYMAGNKTCDEVESVIISIDTDSGIQGWGECCPIPHYLPAYARGIAPALTEIAPIIIGADPVGPEALMLKVNKHLQGHNYAKSPLDIALWDITAKAAKLPLFKLLGGQKQKDMPLYHSITCIAPDEMVRIAKEKQKEGITQFQVKLGADNNWQVDAERLIKVREAIDDQHLVYGDWNCGSTPLDAIRTSRKVAHLDIMLEQPCATLSECASVKQATGLSMKLDEGVYDTKTLLEGYEKGIMDVAALKISKFGGISAIRDARELCSYFGTKMCIEDTWGSDITTAALLHLGISCDPSRLLNVCDLSGYVSPRLDQNGPTRVSGRIQAPSGIGIGIEPDRDLLGKPEIILD